MRELDRRSLIISGAGVLLTGQSAAADTLQEARDLLSIGEKLKQRMLDALMEGSDLAADDKDCARNFLSRLIDRDYARISVPLARRLMAHPGWRDHMTLDAVYAFSSERHAVVTVLSGLPRTPTCDPEAEYYVGMAAELSDRLGMGM